MIICTRIVGFYTIITLGMGGWCNRVLISNKCLLYEYMIIIW